MRTEQEFKSNGSLSIVVALSSTCEALFWHIVLSFLPGRGVTLAHITHHALGHRQDLRNLPRSALDKVAMLTRVDRELYLVALGEILVEVAWLESPAGLGRRVLCDEVIEKLEPELAYLDMSFASLCRDARDKSMLGL